MKRGQVLLVDTDIIIEAFRTRCWSHFGEAWLSQVRTQHLFGGQLS